MRSLFNPFKKILDFIVYSNLFISVCAALFTIQTSIVFQDSFDKIMEFVLPNFISTFILYNLQRLYYASIHPENNKYIWYSKNRRLLFTLIALILICSFNLLWDFFLENTAAVFAYIILASISFFYFLPPLQLRKYGTLKPFIIAFVFICSCIILPLLGELNSSVLIYSLSQFCFIAALCVLFDVRDINHDKEGKVNTLPIKYGITITKYIVVVLILAYLILAFFVKQKNVLITCSIISTITLLLAMISKPSRHNYFYLFLVDGCILLQCLLLLTFAGDN